MNDSKLTNFAITCLGIGLLIATVVGVGEVLMNKEQTKAIGKQVELSSKMTKNMTLLHERVQLLEFKVNHQNDLIKALLQEVGIGPIIVQPIPPKEELPASPQLQAI